MVERKRISELPSATSIVGLCTLGVNAQNEGVKISLERLVTTGAGLMKDASGAISIKLTSSVTDGTESGLSLDSKGLSVKVKKGGALSYSEYGELQVKLGSGLGLNNHNGIHIRVGTGLELDSNGELRVQQDIIDGNNINWKKIAWV